MHPVTTKAPLVFVCCFLVATACTPAATPAPATSPPGKPAAGAAAAPAAPGQVAVKEWAIEPKDLQAKAGKTTFTVRNRGNIEHDFVVEGVGKIDSILPGQTKSLEIDARPGTYPVICSLAGHKEAGMTGQLVVSG